MFIDEGKPQVFRIPKGTEKIGCISVPIKIESLSGLLNQLKLIGGQNGSTTN